VTARERNTAPPAWSPAAGRPVSRGRVARAGQPNRNTPYPYILWPQAQLYGRAGGFESLKRPVHTPLPGDSQQKFPWCRPESLDVYLIPWNRVKEKGNRQYLPNAKNLPVRPIVDSTAFPYTAACASSTRPSYRRVTSAASLALPKSTISCPCRWAARLRKATWPRLTPSATGDAMSCCNRLPGPAPAVTCTVLARSADSARRLTSGGAEAHAVPPAALVAPPTGHPVLTGPTASAPVARSAVQSTGCWDQPGRTRNAKERKR